jgi:hypothetical protein
MHDDGFGFIHVLDDPWAPHPVVNKHIMNGGGGSSISTTPPQQPDYTNTIGAMTGYGNEIFQWGRDLYKWAQDNGVSLKDLANTVSNRAGSMADWATGKAKDTMANWESTYGPIYQAQAKNTLDFIKDLPATMESWAGKYGADAVAAIDQGKDALYRKLRGQGLTRPGIAQTAIDATQTAQRALAGTAAAETGRMAAREYADKITGQTTQAGAIFPQVSSGLQSSGAAYGNQQLGAPESAVSTTAAAYNPAITSFNSAYPYLNTQATLMSKGYDQALSAFNSQVAAQKASNEAESASSPLNFIAPIAGMALSAVSPALSAGVGSLMGPATQGIMSATRSRVATGGTITPMMATAGSVPPPMPVSMPMAGRTVPPQLSPSGGRSTDDVMATVGGNPGAKAAINVGEFIFPRDVTDWYGEEKLQKMVAKARQDRQQNTVAAPTMGPGAINTAAPTGASA